MKKIIAVAVIAAASSAAMAQTSNFTGFSAGINTEFKSTNLKISGGGLDFSGLGKSNTIFSVTGDYGIDLGGSNVMLVGMKLDLQNTTILDVQAPGQSITFKEKSHYQAFVAPGKVLNPDTLAYVKLGYDHSKGAIDSPKSSDSQSINGFTYGIGVRTKLSDQWYLNVEAGRTGYTSKDLTPTASGTASTTYGLVGLSYKF